MSARYRPALTAFRPLGDRGCVRRAAAESGRPEGGLPDVQLPGAELEVVDLTQAPDQLQILHADRATSLSRYSRYRRHGLLMSNFCGAPYVDVPSDTADSNHMKFD
jgi:hypothetical protein